MIVQNPVLFRQLAEQLESHSDHKISLTVYRNDGAIDEIGVKCENCSELLTEFLPTSDSSDRPDPEQVRYEGH